MWLGRPAAEIGGERACVCVCVCVHMCGVESGGEEGRGEGMMINIATRVM